MKRIVVASGKGGTGKTTLAAVFAYLAAREWRVVVADADVEASNLPLALRATGSECTAFSGGSGAAIDESLCTACGACEAVCRFDAIRSVGAAFSVDPLTCEGCGRCARVCPTGAITMCERAVGEACSASSTVGAVAYGQLGPGQDLSGRLVTEVRRRASVAAERDAADIVLIDGPPGVGCPLIAAAADTDVLVAVAEPSVSGVHDLGRLIELARRMKIPVAVVLNKADLAEDAAERVRELCRSAGLPVAGEVPFDSTVAGMLESMAAGGSFSDIRTPALQAIEAAWNEISCRVTEGDVS